MHQNSSTFSHAPDTLKFSKRVLRSLSHPSIHNITASVVLFSRVNPLKKKGVSHAQSSISHAPNHPMASPPTLPMSNPSQSSPSPIATPAFRAFLSRLSSSIRHGLSHRRPWSELVDRSSMARPDSLTEAYTRIRKNLSYFRVNYLTLLALVLALSLLSHPFSLVVLLSLFAAWAFLYAFRQSDQPLIVFGRTFSDRETLLGLSLLTVIVVFLTSVGSLLISALMIGFAIVCAHGAFRVPDDLFLDDQEPANSGFLSFLGGAAASAPAVASRV